MPSNADLKDALKASARLIEDLLHVWIAHTECDPLDVEISRKRIMARGGTLAYIADIQDDNRAVLGIKVKTNAERLARLQRSWDRSTPERTVPETIVSDLLSSQSASAPRTCGEMPVDPRDTD